MSSTASWFVGGVLAESGEDLAAGRRLIAGLSFSSWCTRNDCPRDVRDVRSFGSVTVSSVRPHPVCAFHADLRMPSTRSRPVIAVSSAESRSPAPPTRCGPTSRSSLRAERRGTQRSIPALDAGLVECDTEQSRGGALVSRAQPVQRRAEHLQPNPRPFGGRFEGQCRRSLAGIEQRLLVQVLGCSTVEQDLDRGGARRGEMRRRGGDLVQCARSRLIRSPARARCLASPNAALK